MHDDVGCGMWDGGMWDVGCGMWDVEMNCKSTL